MKSLQTFFIFCILLGLIDSTQALPRVGRVLGKNSTPENESTDDQRTGKEAAAQYFSRRAASENSVSPSDHYLALHVGKLMSGDSWEWGQNGKETDTGSGSFGVTYRIDEWNNSMDVNLRIDFNEYNVVGEKPLKMSLMPLWTFPESSSKFPLYFGFGAGLGVFFKQVKDESSLAFDYQLVAGARFFNVFENTGFFIETGLKNHVQLLTSGQYNGTFLTVGAVFTF